MIYFITNNKVMCMQEHGGIYSLSDTGETPLQYKYINYILIYYLSRRANIFTLYDSGR